MEIINQILAGFIQSFKAKNPKIYAGIMIVLVLVYLGIDMAIAQGLFADGSMLPKVLQWIDVVFMALFGSKTAPYIKEYLDQVSLQSTDIETNWWTSLVDGFKLKSPLAFGIIATVLITFFVGAQYAIYFNVIPEGSVATLLNITSYVDMAVLILLGSKTGQYLADHPPVAPEKGAVMLQSAEHRAMYYD